MVSRSRPPTAHCGVRSRAFRSVTSNTSNPMPLRIRHFSFQCSTPHGSSVRSSPLRAKSASDTLTAGYQVGDSQRSTSRSHSVRRSTGIQSHLSSVVVHPRADWSYIEVVTEILKTWAPSKRQCVQWSKFSEWTQQLDARRNRRIDDLVTPEGSDTKAGRRGSTSRRIGPE